MNNIIRIMVAGGIATILQKSIGLNSFSLYGFLFFLLVFTLISFLWHFILPNKEVVREDEEISKEIIEENNIHKQEVKKKFKKLFHVFVKLLLFVVFLIVLNASVNYISYKLSIFDKELLHDYKNTRAVSLNLEQKPLKKIRIDKENYFLYKNKNKYYLLKTKDTMAKKNYLTIFEPFPIYKVYNDLKDESNFLDIMNNLLPSVYKEVTIKDIFFSSFYFSNKIDNIFFMQYDRKKITQQYNKYITNKKRTLERKKRLEREKEYKKLLLIDYKKLNQEELSKLIKDLYNYYAFTKDTRYIIKLFDKSTDKKLMVHQFRLLSYLQLFSYKERLNDILRKYSMGVVYTFNFWDRQPLDIPLQKNSHLRLVDLKKVNTRYLLAKQDVKSIDIKGNILRINYNSGEKVTFTRFQENQLKSIQKKLSSMIKYINFIQKEFESLKK